MSILQENHVKYGLSITAFITICMFWMYLTNDYSKVQGQAGIEGLLIAFVPLLAYLFGLKAKKRLQKGKLTFKQGVSESFKISVVAGLTSPFIFLFFYLFLSPELIDYARQAYQMTGASDATVVAIDLLIQLVGSIIFGTLFGALITLFLKTKA